MPTVAELDRLDALVRRLTPIGGVARGELIRAEDWNAVVNALIEVLRAVLADGTAAAVPPHEHQDQVAMGWLDPRVRALVERGPLADPGAVSRVDGIDRRIAQAADRMGRLEDTIREARTIASDVSVRDERRANDLDGVRRRLDALPDAREDITNLRETLSGLQGDVRRAIDVGAGLQVNGQAFDAQGLADRVGVIEDLRTRWTAPDGTILDAAALEGRLAELTNTFVTRPELDDALHTHDFQLPGAQFDALADRLNATLADRFEGDLAHTAADIRGELATGLAGIDAIASQKVGDAVGGLSDSILASARAEFAAQLQGTRTELQATIAAQVAAAETRIGTAVDTRIAGVGDQVAAALMPQVDGRIAAAVGPLRGDIDRIDAGSRGNTDAIAGLAAAQAQTAARVEVVARGDDQARKALQASMLAELDTRLGQQSAAIDARFASLDQTIRDRLDVAVRDATNSLAAQMDQIASAAAQREAQTVGAQIRGEVREIAREEATTAAAGIRTDVQLQLDRSNAQLPGLISGEVRRQTATLPDLVRDQVNTSIGPGLIRPGPG